MTRHHRTPSASIVFVSREGESGTEVLLQHRNQTHMLPNIWDGVGGHVEAGESVREAAQRELKEEVGLDIAIEDLSFLMVTHNQISPTERYYNFFFKTARFNGTPEILEPHKHDALQWFSLKNLPSPIITDRNLALTHWQEPLGFLELNTESDVKK